MPHEQDYAWQAAFEFFLVSMLAVELILQAVVPAVCVGLILLLLLAGPCYELLRRHYERLRREALHGPPQCVKCRYNLTGNVSGTCPCRKRHPARLEQ